jgi:exonuclease VII small subunit
MQMARITDLHSLYDFIGYVVLCAPSSFPQREYLRPEEQMNLERAFRELKDGIQFAAKNNEGTFTQELLLSVLDESLALYTSGNEVAAAHRLQDFQDLIFQGQAGHA